MNGVLGTIHGNRLTNSQALSGARASAFPHAEHWAASAWATLRSLAVVQSCLVPFQAILFARDRIQTCPLTTAWCTRRSWPEAPRLELPGARCLRPQLSLGHCATAASRPVAWQRREWDHWLTLGRQPASCEAGTGEAVRAEL